MPTKNRQFSESFTVSVRTVGGLGKITLMYKDDEVSSEMLSAEYAQQIFKTLFCDVQDGILSAHEMMEE